MQLLDTRYPRFKILTKEMLQKEYSLGCCRRLTCFFGCSLLRPKRLFYILAGYGKIKDTSTIEDGVLA